MTTVKSSKAKARRLQDYVRDAILELDGNLESGTDVRSAIMGEPGEDIKLSKRARAVFPFSVECKAQASPTIQRQFEQAMTNCPKGVQPIVVVKGDRKKPLIIMDFEYFMESLK